ncbi:SprB repeat-containing protein, partial [Portibacter lacus]
YYVDVVSGTCPYTVTRTFRVLDPCLNETICVQTITIDDTTAPVVTCPSDVTLECDGAGNVDEINAWLALATASDVCGDPVITNDFTGVTGPCEGTGTVTVTWTAADECGNFITCSAVLTILDTTDPTADNPVDITIQFIDDIPVVDIEVVMNEMDNCDPNPTVTYTGETDNGGTGCDGDPLIITRIYNIADCTGNNIDVDHVITIEAPALDLSTFTNSILCTGAATGSIAVEASGGTAPYTYDWDNDIYDGLTDLEDLIAGTYTVTVTDAIGCTLVESIEVTEVDEALDVVLGPENPVICIDGEIVIYATVTGGTTPYTYAWNTTNFADDSIRVSTAGTYSVTVTDANGCSDVESIELNVITNPEIDNPGPLEACDSLALPIITGTDLSGNEAYYTEADGQGTQYNAGDYIYTSTTIYIFDETGTEPNCFDEVQFDVIITDTPILDQPDGVTSCDEYELPGITGTGLSGNEAYFDGPGGTGNTYGPGAIISTSTTLYIYDILNGCPAEVSFDIDIVETPIINPDSGLACDSLQLPTIMGTGVAGATYWTGMGGTGTEYVAGDWISTSTTLYMYVAAGACSTEEPFDIVITETPIIDDLAGTACDSFELPTITGSGLSGTEAYYDGPGGTGTRYTAGEFITSSTTLYIYDIVGSCPAEGTITIDIVETPSIDPNSGAACDSLQLPAITGTGTAGATYWSMSGGTGTEYSEGDWIYSSTTLYMVVAAGSCSTEEPFDIVITETPIIDDLAGTACDSFELPTITGSGLSGNEAYYDGPGGTGTRYTAGEFITSSTTLYIYDIVGSCPAEGTITIDIVETPSIDPNSGAACDSLQLPAITGTGTAGATYWSMSGGTGTEYSEGDWIYSSTTLYMVVAAGSCSTEEPFVITITDTPELDPISNVTSCDEYILPEITGNNLSGNESYWTGMGGTGTQYIAGDAITSTTTLYVYDINGTCPAENSFTVEIVETPSIDPNSGTACDSLELPLITGVGAGSATYWTGMGGTGTEYVAGDFISTNTTLYMYVAAGSCSTEESFAITITPTAEIDGGAGTACDEFELPAITGTNLAGDEAYYTEMNGGGTVYNAGDLIDMSQTLYIYGDDNGCPSEAEFIVTIVE